MMLTTLQPPSVHHNPSCDGVSICACDAEERKENTKKEIGQQNIAKERLGVIQTSVVQLQACGPHVAHGQNF